MQLFLRIVKWGGIPVGIIISALSIVSDARDISGWAIPIWVWYSIGLLVIVVSSSIIIIGLWRENQSLRKPLEQQQSEEVRKERVRLRGRYSGRRIIPELLYQMSERARELTENNPMELVTSDYDEDITSDLREILQVKDVKKIRLNTKDMLKILTKIPSLRKYKNPTHQVRALAISFYQVLSSHGEGVMPLVEKDTEYQRLNKEVEEYLIGLPQSIHFKKDAHIQLANAYYTIMAVDFSKIEQPALVRLSQPFFRTAIESELSTIRADISSSIEKYLIGEDVK